MPDSPRADRQPRRDRHARDPQLPTAGHRDRLVAHSEADRDSLPARLADRAICIGPSRPADSYLNMNAIVQAALGTGCDAIHPGYGFLSERAPFAKLCEDNAIRFIGPTAAQIDAVGDKLRARAEAIAADVPVVPGGAVASRGGSAAAGGTDRRAAADQGGGRRRRTRHEARRQAGRPGVRQWTWPRRRPALHSATRACTWNATSKAAGMWKCRCWATVPAP